MDVILTKEIEAGLNAARRKARKASLRLRIEAGEASHPVLRAWDGGFALSAESPPVLRGRVALFDGAKLLSHCLIVASEEEGDELRFEYKSMTDAVGEQPLDFYRAPDAPVALIEANN